MSKQNEINFGDRIKLGIINTIAVIIIYSILYALQFVLYDGVLFVALAITWVASVLRH